MNAIISPYEASLDDQNTLVPAVVNDTLASSFESSDLPESMLDYMNGERLIFLDATAHAQALVLGYSEVDVAWP